MSVTLEQMIAMNATALKALNDSVLRLRTLRMGASITMRNRLTAEVNEVESEITRLNLINAHLGAAEVTVEPMSQADEAELEQLADALDEAILQDRIVSADFQFIVDLLDKAQDLGDLIQMHT